VSARAAVTTSVAAVERVVAIWAQSRIVRRTYSTTELDVYAETVIPAGEVAPTRGLRLVNFLMSIRPQPRTRNGGWPGEATGTCACVGGGLLPSTTTCVVRDIIHRVALTGADDAIATSDAIVASAQLPAGSGQGVVRSG
jgi:hypothetical protein